MPYILWFSQTKGTSPPLVFIPHNLNHVSAFSYSCFVLPRLALAYLSLHLTYHWCVDLSTYVILSFHILFLFFAPIIFCLCHYCQTKFDFEISPPGSCLSPFIFFHFSIFSSPLTLPDFTSASLLHLLVVCLLV